MYGFEAVAVDSGTAMTEERGKGAKNGNAGGRRMNMEWITRLEKLLDRELATEEKERLRRIQDTLHLSAEDALWEHTPKA